MFDTYHLLYCISCICRPVLDFLLCLLPAFVLCICGEKTYSLYYLCLHRLSPSVINVLVSYLDLDLDLLNSHITSHNNSVNFCVVGSFTNVIYAIIVEILNLNLSE